MKVPIEVLPVPTLRGTCHRCGACCQIALMGITYTCDHLEVGGEIGTPSATRCRVYTSRSHFMPITMTAPGGRRLHANCAADGTPEDVRAIIAKGIATGVCSYEVVG